MASSLTRDTIYFPLGGGAFCKHLTKKKVKENIVNVMLNFLQHHQLSCCFIHTREGREPSPSSAHY